MQRGGIGFKRGSPRFKEKEQTWFCLKFTRGVKKTLFYPATQLSKECDLYNKFVFTFCWSSVRVWKKTCESCRNLTKIKAMLIVVQGNTQYVIPLFWIEWCGKCIIVPCPGKFKFTYLFMLRWLFFLCFPHSLSFCLTAEGWQVCDCLQIRK